MMQKELTGIKKRGVNITILPNLTIDIDRLDKDCLQAIAKYVEDGYLMTVIKDDSDTVLPEVVVVPDPVVVPEPEVVKPPNNPLDVLNRFGK
jgi:hypothetical protein